MAKPKVYDFSGWATRFNRKCSDGRTLMRNAFKDNDGGTVPLVWNHNHHDQASVLGHAYLENKEDGVYAYCSFNDTENGKHAKELVKHGDIVALSIYANQLKQNSSKEVIHGNIREVSLVLAGANPGAYIETVLAHSDEETEEAICYNYEEGGSLEMYHSDDNPAPTPANDEKNIDNKTVQTVLDSMTDEQREVLYLLVGLAAKQGEEVQHSDEENKDENLSHADGSAAEGEASIQAIIDSMTDEQREVLYLLVGIASDDKEQDSNEGGQTEMKHNVFEGITNDKGEELTHSDLIEVIADAKRNGSMKESFLAHGITGVENLFPEVQSANKAPEMVMRDLDWVSVVMHGVHHTPFSRVKSTYATLTADEARARGYVKGNLKVEQVIAALKRSTNPQTVYIKQAMDRDDIIDITDFDVVAWIKAEMRHLLEEECARALLIGDGRGNESDDKINPLNIRPIYGDDPVYTVKRVIQGLEADEDGTVFAKKLIKDVIRSRKEYKGSGNPTLFTTEDMLTSMLLIEDKNGRVIYDTIEKLKTALRVSNIVTIPVMENIKRVVGEREAAETYVLHGILVNLADYNVGADKGGQVAMFDDFDIDYNKEKYLMETRFSGALVKPYSAITFEEKVFKPAPAKVSTEKTQG